MDVQRPWLTSSCIATPRLTRVGVRTPVRLAAGGAPALVDAERDDLASWEIARRSGRSLVDLDEMANQRSDLPHRGRDSDGNGASADR